MYVEQTAGDMYVVEASADLATGVVSLRSARSILDANDTAFPDIQAHDIALVAATGSLGTSANALEIDAAGNQWATLRGSSDRELLFGGHIDSVPNGGWLDDVRITAVARYLGQPAIYAYEVATFYSMFQLEPVGRNEVAVCTNISCWLNGALDIVKHCERKLGIRNGQSTADGRVFLKEEEECLAACCGAPMMVVNGHYHENLTPAKVDEILDGLK